MNASDSSIASVDQKQWRQILVDAPRTCPSVPLVHTDFVQRVRLPSAHALLASHAEMTESGESAVHLGCAASSVRLCAGHQRSGSSLVRCLLEKICWSVLAVFVRNMTAHLAARQDLDCADLSSVSDEQLASVEADVFWCLTKLLDNIQVC